jgi:hypothetical protein
VKLNIRFTPDLVAMMHAEVAAGQKAVSVTMAEAGASLKSAWRGQITGAGLGQRLANTIRAQTYPKGRNSLDPPQSEQLSRALLLKVYPEAGGTG